MAVIHSFCCLFSGSGEMPQYYTSASFFHTVSCCSLFPLFPKLNYSPDFERIFEDHKDLCVVDPRLRDLLQKEVAGVFLPDYRLFFDKYSKIRFSKKHQSEYTKYSPYKIEELLNQLYNDPE